MKQKSILYSISLFLMTILLLTTATSISAQTENHKAFWIHFGIGVGSVGEESIGVNANATYQMNQHLFSFRIVGSGEMFGKNLNDYSLLYGRILTSSTLLTSVGVGFGLVNGTISHGLFSETETIEITPGLPFEAQVFWRPLRFLGIGFYGFANINSEESFYGCNLSLQIGKLR